MIWAIIGKLVVYIIGGYISMFIPSIIAMKYYEKKYNYDGLSCLAVGVVYGSIGVGIYILGTVIVFFM